MTYAIKRFAFDGTIDADGHVLEPPDLWENYLEARYRERALRIRVDDEGYEYLDIGGRPSALLWASGLGGAAMVLAADIAVPRGAPYLLQAVTSGAARASS